MFQRKESQSFQKGENSMEPTYLVLITIFATIGFIFLTKILYTRIAGFFARISKLEKAARQWIVEYNDLNIDRNDFRERFDDLGMWHERLKKVEDITDNFDRDMDSYHHRINRDNANFTIKYNKVIDKFKKGLGNAFKWLAKLEGFVEANEGSLVKVWTRIKKVESRLKSLEDIQLIHAHSIAL